MDYEPSLVEDSRILAMRASYAGEENTDLIIDTLAYGVENLILTICAAPWLPTEDGIECLTPTWDLPTDENLSATIDTSAVLIPPELLAYTQSLYIKASSDNPVVVPTILEVSLIAPPDNPNLIGVELDGQSVDEWTGPQGESVEVTPKWENTGDETGTSISFYTTSGRFSPWRVQDGGPSSWTPDQGSTEPALIYVIARKLGSGTTWKVMETTP